MKNIYSLICLIVFIQLQENEGKPIYGLGFSGYPGNDGYDGHDGGYDGRNHGYYNSPYNGYGDSSEEFYG